MSNVFYDHCENNPHKAIYFEHDGETFHLSFLDVATILIQDEHPLLALAKEFVRGSKDRNIRYTFFRGERGPIDNQSAFEAEIRKDFTWKLRPLASGVLFKRLVDTATRLLMTFYSTNRNPLPSAEQTFSVSFDVTEKEQADLKFNLEWFKIYCAKRKSGDTNTCTQLREALNSHRRSRGEESYGHKTPSWLEFQRETMDKQEEFNIVWTGSASHRMLRFGSLAVPIHSFDPQGVEALRENGKLYLSVISDGSKKLEDLFEKFVVKYEPRTESDGRFGANELYDYMVQLSHTVVGMPIPTQGEVRNVRKTVDGGDAEPIDGTTKKRGTGGKLNLKRKYPETKDEKNKLESCKIIKTMLSILDPKVREDGTSDVSLSPGDTPDEKPSFKVFRHQGGSILALFKHFVEMGSKMDSSEGLTKSEMTSLWTYASWHRIHLDAEFFGPLLVDLKPEDYVESSSLWAMAGYFYFHDAKIKNDLIRFNHNCPSSALDEPLNISLPNHLKYGEWYGIPKDVSGLTPHVITPYIIPIRETSKPVILSALGTQPGETAIGKDFSNQIM